MFIGPNETFPFSFWRSRRVFHALVSETKTGGPPNHLERKNEESEECCRIQTLVHAFTCDQRYRNCPDCRSRTLFPDRFYGIGGRAGWLGTNEYDAPTRLRRPGGDGVGSGHKCAQEKECRRDPRESTESALPDTIRELCTVRLFGGDRRRHGSCRGSLRRTGRSLHFHV